MILLKGNKGSAEMKGSAWKNIRITTGPICLTGHITVSLFSPLGTKGGRTIIPVEMPFVLSSQLIIQVTPGPRNGGKDLSE